MSKVILGSGISGLSAGYYALNKFPHEVITILEKTNRTGGWLKTTKLDDGSIFEQAARTIRPKGEAGGNTLRLIDELEASDEIIPVSSNSPAALNRMIYANGKLHSLPNSLISIFTKTEPFSRPLFTYLFNDITAKRQNLEDESLYSFVNRRLGSEVADYLVSPMVCGICGGDAKEISVKFLMKPLFEKEQKYGSITRGIIADFVKRKSSIKSMPTFLENRAHNEKWNVYSFKQGIEYLPNAIKRNIVKRGVDIKLNTSVKDIEVYKKAIIVHTNDGAVHVGNHLVSSIPAIQLAPLLKKQHPYLTELLSSFKSASMCVVNLKYDEEILNKKGFGFLVAPKEDLPLLGVIYDTCCFPQKNTTILTVMMGGYKFDKYFTTKTSDEEAVDVALKHIEITLGINAKPNNFKVNILHECIPQYTVGHYNKVDHIVSYLKTNNLALSICGASYFGVGVNDVILSAKKAIDDI